MELKLLSIVVHSLLLVVTKEYCEVPGGQGKECGHGRATSCYHSHCTCTCDSGWEGGCCSSGHNYCSGKQCNHGTCHNGIDSYSCTCNGGYSGYHCDTDVNECASNPCLHSGVCHDHIDRYSCTCPSGYTGTHCETDINECVSSPCQNKGRCIDHVLGYTCECSKGYTGKHCETNIECHSSPCLNGGICTNNQASGHTCHCRLGFTGHNCETEPFILVKPKIILPENKTVPDGYKQLIIPCYAEGIPQPVITWNSLDRLSIPNNARQLVHFLVFQNVSTIDAGQYMCTARNKVGTDIQVIEIIVTAKDEKLIAPVIHAPSSVQVKYYFEGRLTCNVTGDPTPTVIWKHNSKVVQSSGNTLVIHRVTNTTTGTYTCIAQNDAGISQANIQLKVTYDVPKIINPPVTSVIMSGQTHNFSCIATGHPEPSIKWTYRMYIKHTTDMPPHQLHNRGTVLTLYSITTQESGLLTCTAQNEFGEDHVSVSVIVRSPNPVG